MAVIRETDENGKPLVVVGEDYSWVKGEVRELSSWFLDTDSVEQIGDPAMWVREGSGIKLRFLPCKNSDRVYHRGEGWEYFFIYTTVFLDVGVKFPFSEFECGVLSQLKCAPTQIHPNACSEGRANDVEQCAGEGIVRFVSESYKDFKEIFVKVTCVEDQFPFYLDEFGLERFPLYWYSEPVQILGMNKIVLLGPLFLVGTIPTSLWYYLYDSVHLPRSERIKGVVVNQPPEKKRVPSMKRRRVEERGSGKKVIDLTLSKCCGKEVSLEEVKVFAEKQKKLHGYIGEEDLTSVWSEHFPFSVLAEEHFQSKTDLDLIGSVDGVTRAQFMQELKAREEAGQKEDRSKEIQKVLEAERKLQLVTEQLSLKEKELLEMKTDNEQLKGKLQKFDKEKTELEARVVELCVQKKDAETSKENHGYDMMTAGFERARKQAQFLFPDIKFDLEGGDDHDPEDGAA
ncbi:hypothetical protein PIB30_019645 [Stylosanthes scabra]|uniref:Uncharacterized protein n=1 Tax=Stylosanthes scabra TaxID=79078 RepID=A0ABU6S9N4_9FABA|nr:hypothetical protein [Stylosanthes scabra]